MISNMHPGGHTSNASNTSQLTQDAPPHISEGNEAFMLLTSCLLWLLVPGCGFFYAGMAQTKSALSMILLSLYAVAIVSIQWFLFGYTLAFSITSGNRFIGDFRKAFLLGVELPSYPEAEDISEISFCLYQGVTATLPAALISGALAERARFLPALIFIFLWTSLVYVPCTYWSLNPNGWAHQMGGLDFGGAQPVHVPSATAALVYSYFLGPRTHQDRVARPHSMLCLVVGTVLIWFGSFGYNAGSAFGASLQSIMSSIVTNLSASICGLTWTALDYVFKRRFDAFGFCAGSVVGLVVITPASGYIDPGFTFIFGITAAAVSRWGHIVKDKWRFDDALDVFAMHGLSGVVGSGFFAQKKYIGDAVSAGGFIDGNYMQPVYQLLEMSAGFSWSFLVSFSLLWTMDRIPFLRLRMPEEECLKGMDELQTGFSSYHFVDEIRIHVECATWPIPSEQPSQARTSAIEEWVMQSVPKAQTVKVKTLSTKVDWRTYFY